MYTHTHGLIVEVGETEGAAPSSGRRANSIKLIPASKQTNVTIHITEFFSNIQWIITIRWKKKSLIINRSSGGKEETELIRKFPESGIVLFPMSGKYNAILNNNWFENSPSLIFWGRRILKNWKMTSSNITSFVIVIVIVVVVVVRDCSESFKYLSMVSSSVLFVPINSSFYKRERERESEWGREGEERVQMLLSRSLRMWTKLAGKTPRRCGSLST